MVLIKTEKEIETMAQGGKILAGIMQELEKKVKPGISTKELDKAAEGLVLKYGGKCSFKNYQKFPACLCVSVNQEVVHGVPSDKIILKEGDIVSLDLGLFYKGFHTDMAITLGVGLISPEAQRLIKTTKKAMKRGIKKMLPGNTLGDVGNSIQRYVEAQGFGIIRDLCGHGIGREIHEEPQVLNYGKRHKGLKIKQGMVLCLEPMVSEGSYELIKSENNFAYETADGLLSCHFEHTIAILKNGVKILTSLDDSI